jgi:hypothetical protein
MIFYLFSINFQIIRLDKNNNTPLSKTSGKQYHFHHIFDLKTPIKHAKTTKCNASFPIQNESEYHLDNQMLLCGVPMNERNVKNVNMAVTGPEISNIYVYQYHYVPFCNLCHKIVGSDIKSSRTLDQNILQKPRATQKKLMSRLEHHATHKLRSMPASSAATQLQ